MFSLIKKIVILIISIPSAFGYCFMFKYQKCKVRKAIIDNHYMTFPYTFKLISVL